MIVSVKKIIFLLLIVFLLGTSESCRPKPSGGYNPYLHKKEKLSAIELQKQTKADRKARRAYRKQMRRTSMKFYGHKPGPKK